jgi:hypothetical protein
MAVTNYTTLLGLALPTTGDLSGTWGDTVNTSITSLLDSAIAGTTTLSTDTDVTLSTTNGASNQARQQIIVCSGARTVLRTITAPAASKSYIIINATTGGFGVKIVGAGPTTGVTIANGRSALVSWNGSDFVTTASNDITALSGLGTGVATALGTAINTTGGLVTQSGTLASNAVLLGGGASTAITSTSTGTGVVTALGQNVSGSGSIVLSTGAALSAETFSTSASVSAAGTTQGTGTALTSDYNVVTTAAASSGVVLPTATTGRRVIVVNKGANAVNVYPASGGTIDALAANAAISLPVAGYIEFNASSTTQWYSTYNTYVTGTGVSSFSAGTTGFTPSTATTGAITLAGTLAIANGGTNSTATPTSGGVGYGTGTAHAYTAAGTAGQVLTSNGSGAPTWSSASGGGISYTRVTANTTLTNNQGVIADTTGGTFTVTLPATPSSGNQVWIADGGSWGTTNLTVGRNGSTIEGTAADLTLDISGVEIQMIYDGTTWNVYVLGGAAGVTTTGSGSTVLATSPTITTPTISGNETYTGSGGRILADFDNATVTNRRAFQTSTTDASTGIYALPNGTSTVASWQATNSSDPTNASKIFIATNASTDVQLVSGINGSGTYLPLSFYNNGSRKMQLSTAGSFGIGPAFSPTNNALLELAAGTTSVAPARLTSGTNLTSPVAGTVEYDGIRFYGTTDTTSGRGYFPTVQIFRLAANGSAITTIANFFGSNSAAVLAAGGSYELEAYCYFTKATAATVTVTLTTSAAVINLNGTVQYGAAAGGTATGAANQISLFASATTANAFGASASLTAANHAFIIRAVFDASAGGGSDIRINFAATSGSLTPLRNSYYKVTRLPSSNTGNFNP